MQKKIEMGARFFQTQANYDNEDFRQFLIKTREMNTKVLSGVLILHSFEIATYIHENIPGIRMPADVLKRFEKARTANRRASTLRSRRCCGSRMFVMDFI